MTRIIRINSVAEVLEVLQERSFREFGTHKPRGKRASIDYKYPFGIWFRGQADSTWGLTPVVFRTREGHKDVFLDESGLFNHFQLRVPEHHQTYRNTFDWLCLMQHYELPTRLLDWTESALVALYFVVTNRKHWSVNGRLFALNAQRLNEEADLSGDVDRVTIGLPSGLNANARAQLAVARDVDYWKDRMTRLKYSGIWASDKLESICEKVGKKDKDACNKLAAPTAVFPNRLNGRMVLQSSVFTIHGGKLYRDSDNTTDDALPRPLTLESINAKLPSNKQFLRSYIIPKGKKKSIEEELRALGIHHGSLFPELDWQARYIKEQWQWSS